MVLIVWNLTQNGRKVATNDKGLMLQFGRVAPLVLAAWAGNGQLLSKLRVVERTCPRQSTLGSAGVLAGWDSLDKAKPG